MKYLTNLDLSTNQLQNAVIHPLDTAPVSPKAGQVYYNTTDQNIYYYNGSSWESRGEYMFSGKAGATNYIITITSSGSEEPQTVTIPLATKALAGVVKVDDTMSDDSTNPVQNNTVKTYIDTAIADLPVEQFLDLNKTVFVQNFTWSEETYPSSTNPNYNGKPVLVLALKDADDNVAYSFLNLEDLIDTYSGTAPITVSDGTISHNNSGVSANTYGLDSNVTPNFGETFDVPQVVVDAKGHITSATTYTVTMPTAPSTPIIASANIKTGSTTATATLPKNAVIHAVTAYEQSGTTETEVMVDWSVKRGTNATVTVSTAQTVTIPVYCNIVYSVQ